MYTYAASPSHLTEVRARGSTRCVCSKLWTCSSASWQATLGKSHFSSHHHLFSQRGHSFKSVPSPASSFLSTYRNFIFFELPVLLGNLAEISQLIPEKSRTDRLTCRQTEWLPVPCFFKKPGYKKKPGNEKIPVEVNHSDITPVLLELRSYRIPFQNFPFIEEF